MTDDSTPNDGLPDDAMPDDATPGDALPENGRTELASAFLDGEVSSAERRFVQSDPALLDMVDQLAALRVRMAAAPVVDPDLREHNIAAALAEFAVIVADAPPSLTVARARKARPAWATVVPLGAVAAVIVALIGLAVALRPGGDDGDVTAADVGADTSLPAAETEAFSAGGAEGGDQATAAADESGDQATAGAAEAAEEQAADVTTQSEASSLAGESTQTTVATGVPGSDGTDTGASATTEAASATTVAAPLTTAAASPSEPPLVGTRSAAEHDCDEQLHDERPDLGLGALIAVQPVEPDGTQRLGYRLADDSGSIAVVIDPESCQVVDPTP
jgi:hypothetical protein